LQFSIDPGIEKGGFSIQVRKNVFLICKEAINNAVKYSECRNIAVNLSLLAGIMELHVADNGQGFDPDLRRNGNGLANMRARAAEMNAAINIDSGGEGTRILIRVPVPRFR
jgi:signal transduction histidine kinase